MQNKIKQYAVMIAMFSVAFAMPAFAEGEFGDELSAQSIAMYDVENSLFQRITDLEQEKILMQLEKERAQLDLELDRLAAEKIKLHMEIDTLAGRAEEQQQLFEAEKALLEAEAKALEKQSRLADDEDDEEANTLASKATKSTKSTKSTKTSAKKQDVEVVEGSIESFYRLVDIIGAGTQLQATLESLNNGQRKKISVGKTLDGYSVKSISLDDGVIFVKDGVTETLNISREK